MLLLKYIHYPIFLVLFFFYSKSFAQNYRNELGIGIGNIVYEKYIYENNLLVESPFYNNYDKVYDHWFRYEYWPRTESRKISVFQTPTLYYSRNLFKKLVGRINCSYRSQITSYGYFNQINSLGKEKRIKFSTGIQYNFKLQKWTIYPVLEYAPYIEFHKSLYYNLSSGGLKTLNNKFYYSNVNLSIGINYLLKKRLSISYESGLYYDYWAPVSRLSLNYSFK